MSLQNVSGKCLRDTFFMENWHYRQSLFNGTVYARALSPFNTGRSPLIRGILQIADSSRMKTMRPPHNLVGGIYPTTLIRPIKYSSVGTRYTGFVVNGNLALDTQRGSTPLDEPRSE